MPSARLRESFSDDCIRDVDAIPGYQEIHAMYGCYGNVGSVGSSLPGEPVGSQDGRRQHPDLGCDVEQGEMLNRVQPFARGIRITRPCFIDHELRDVNLEGVPSLLPHSLVICWWPAMTKSRLGREVR